MQFNALPTAKVTTGRNTFVKLQIRFAVIMQVTLCFHTKMKKRKRQKNCLVRGCSLKRSRFFKTCLSGDVAHYVERRTGTPLTPVRFPGAASDFSPRVNFQCRLSYGVCTPPCAVAYNNTCAHAKDPVVQVKVPWIMETLKHPACTVGWVAQLFPWESRL